MYVKGRNCLYILAIANYMHKTFEKLKTTLYVSQCLNKAPLILITFERDLIMMPIIRVCDQVRHLQSRAIAVGNHHCPTHLHPVFFWLLP